MASEAVLTFRQAARRLGLSIPTLRRWQRQGLLPEAYRGEDHQGVWVLREADLEAVAERNGWAGRTEVTGSTLAIPDSAEGGAGSDRPVPSRRMFDYYRQFLPGSSSSD